MSRVISVQGTGRCGTSVTAALLTALGIAMDEDLVEAAPMNPKGFYEPRRVVELNEAMRNALGVVDAVAGEWQPDAEHRSAFLEAAAGIEEYVAEMRAAHKLLVLKDPRFARLAWAWRPSLEQHFDEHLVVIVHRSAAGVVASYVRNGRSPEEAAMVWVLRTLGYERGSRDLARVWIRFEDLLSTPIPTFAQVTDFLGMDRASNSIFDRVEPQMDHAADEDAAAIPEALLDLVTEVEELLAEGNPEPNGAAFDAIFERLAREQGRSVQGANR